MKGNTSNTARASGRLRGIAAREAICAATAFASVSLAAAGCSAASHLAAAPGATGTAASPGATTTPAATSTPPGNGVTPVATSSPSAPGASPAAAAPTLGQSAGVFAHGQGFGQVRPSEIFNGGDPTGLVTHVVWKSWGGARAVATGTSDYVGPNETVAGGREESATVVAFKLGICNGRLMYRAVEWYFPQHKQAFDPHRYEDICTGTYVPGS
jgi:hypothetical protein